MATITIDVDNSIAQRIFDAYSAHMPPAEGTPVGTAAQKLAYVKACILKEIKAHVRAHEATVASATAGAKADAEVSPT